MQKERGLLIHADLTERNAHGMRDREDRHACAMNGGCSKEKGIQKRTRSIRASPLRQNVECCRLQQGYGQRWRRKHVQQTYRSVEENALRFRAEGTMGIICSSANRCKSRRVGHVQGFQNLWNSIRWLVDKSNVLKMSVVQLRMQCQARQLCSVF
jgi:hypothetical protein